MLYGACISCGISRKVVDFSERKCNCGCGQIVEVCNYCASIGSHNDLPIESGIMDNPRSYINGMSNKFRGVKNA